MSLRELKAESDRRWVVFLDAIRGQGMADEWEYYRRYDAGERFPDLHALFWHHLEALYEFYGTRDGPGGVLGGI